MNLLTFDFNLILVLDALLVERSTIKAGEKVGLSQPAVSAALRRLREALGDPLFVRQGQAIVPTEYARSLEVPVRRILDDMEVLLAAKRLFDPAKSKDSFKLSGSDFFAELLMPALAGVLSRRAPLMRVQLVDLVPDNHVGTLINHQIDLALIPRMEFPGWTDHLPVFRSRFVVIARKKHPRLLHNGVNPGQKVPLDLFCDMGHIAFSPEGNLRTMGDAALANIGRRRRVVMTMPVFGGICNAVADSDMIALVPEQIASKMTKRLGLDFYLPPMPINPVPIFMVWHKRNTGDAAHGWLRDTVSEVLASLDKPPHALHLP